jgi:hypothetical protein
MGLRETMNIRSKCVRCPGQDSKRKRPGHNLQRYDYTNLFGLKNLQLKSFMLLLCLE